MEKSSTDKRIEDLAGRVGRFENRVGRFEDRVGRFENRVSRFEENVDRRFERFEDEVDRRFDKVDVGSRSSTKVSRGRPPRRSWRRSMRDWTSGAGS